MPRGFRDEITSRPWYRTMYGIQEHASPNYQPRTRQNVLDADVTLLFGETTSPGSRNTLSYLGGFRKPFWVNPTIEDLQGDLIDTAAPRVKPPNMVLPPRYIVNIAGNRESGNPGIEAYVYRLLIEAWAEGERLEELRRAAPWPDPLPRLTGGGR